MKLGKFKFTKNFRKIKVEDAFRDFHGVRAKNKDIKRIGDKYFWKIGALYELVYGVPEENQYYEPNTSFVHEFNSNVEIFTDGKQIVITGGKLKVKNDGIHG